PTLHITSVPIVTVVVRQDIVRNNEISEKGEHNCEANRLLIQISATSLSPESFIEKFIFEKVSQLNLYPDQIFRDLLGTIRDQFFNTRIASHRKINYQRTAGFNRKEFDRSSHVSPIKSSFKQLAFFFVVIGLEIFMEFNIK
ncbi:hypothetical protein HZS_7319, partial [Henneguya salminicola]